MSIISVPDAYFVYMGCESKQEYISSIVTCTFDANHENIVNHLRERRYAAINGKLIFRHVKTMRTATVIFCADGVYENDSIYLVSKIRHIQWQDDDEIVLILGIICAQMALGTIKVKALTRNDMKYFAFPVQKLNISNIVECESTIKPFFTMTSSDKSFADLKSPELELFRSVWLFLSEAIWVENGEPKRAI